jgi:hypothetical protein
MSDIEEITKLKHLYWHYNDTGFRADEIANLFTEDGVWSSEVMGHYEGREAIRDFFRGAPAFASFCAHLGMNPIIEVDGDLAQARWRAMLFTTMIDNEGETSRQILIDYIDDFVRRDGQWMIRKIDLFFNFNVPVGEGWAGRAVLRPLAVGDSTAKQ